MMLLSCRFLENVTSVNDYRHVAQVEFTEGDAVVVNLQLINASLDREEQGWKPVLEGRPAGRRYVPASGATLQVILKNLDSGRTTTKTATQPFPTTDPSIFRFSIGAGDPVAGTQALQLVLTEGGTITRGSRPAGLRIYPLNSV